MNRLYNAGEKKEGYVKIVDCGNSSLKYIEMGRLYLGKKDGIYEGRTGAREIGINILSGIVKLDVKVDGGAVSNFERVGSRMNVFSGSPEMIYIPINSTYTIQVVKQPFEAVVYSAPSTMELEPVVVTQGESASTKTGYLNWTRYVRRGIADNVNAHRLVMGETLNPSGNWSSYPPHKHDEWKLPDEKPSEEVYLFHFDKPEGFGFIRLYTSKDSEDPFDEAYIVHDGDVVVIDRGYHPIAIAPGYKCCYQFCLAGEERGYGAWRDDPDHHWVKKCETILEETNKDCTQPR